MRDDRAVREFLSDLLLVASVNEVLERLEVARRDVIVVADTTLDGLQRRISTNTVEEAENCRG